MYDLIWFKEFYTSVGIDHEWEGTFRSIFSFDFFTENISILWTRSKGDVQWKNWYSLSHLSTKWACFKFVDDDGRSHKPFGYRSWTRFFYLVVSNRGHCVLWFILPYQPNLVPVNKYTTSQSKQSLSTKCIIPSQLEDFVNTVI